MSFHSPSPSSSPAQTKPYTNTLRVTVSWLSSFAFSFLCFSLFLSFYCNLLKNASTLTTKNCMEKKKKEKVRRLSPIGVVIFCFENIYNIELMVLSPFSNRWLLVNAYNWIYCKPTVMLDSLVSYPTVGFKYWLIYFCFFFYIKLYRAPIIDN